MSYINSIKVGDTTYPISLNTSTIVDGLKLTNDGVLTPNIGTGLQLNKQNPNQFGYDMASAVRDHRIAQTMFAIQMTKQQSECTVE